MSDKIREFINEPEKLERLYREDKESFRAGFEKLYPEIQGSEIAKFWRSRLDFERSAESSIRFFSSDLFIMLGVCLFTGFLIKIPDLFNIDLKSFQYYEKNAGIIVFLGLTIYAFSVRRNFTTKNMALTFLIFVIAAIYVNLLPGTTQSASVNLVYIHMPLMAWCIYGLVFLNFDIKDKKKRMEYIRHNGDLAIMGALILIAGGLLTGITIGLFQAIGLNIENFYSHYIILVGLVSAPIVATFILKNFSILTNKIAPIIANIFSPLVLITLVIYLIAIVVSGKDPYNDRSFLLIFNIMLIGVMGLIVFSVSETSVFMTPKFNNMVLFLLSSVTMIINLIALSAIFYRLGEYGLTPNRIAILGSNLLIFLNLVLITIDLFRINFGKSVTDKAELTISNYLPVYFCWTLIVVFGFPIIFGMK